MIDGFGGLSSSHSLPKFGFPRVFQIKIARFLNLSKSLPLSCEMKKISKVEFKIEQTWSTAHTAASFSTHLSVTKSSDVETISSTKSEI